MHGVALLVALELGLLSPLSCVVHCFIQQLLAERAPISFFLCGEHAPPPSGDSADPAPASPLMPRALYELITLVTPLLVAAGMLVATLVPSPLRRPTRLTLPPPTPPPRLSLV